MQLERASTTLLRDLIIVCVAGTLLGFLFEGNYEKARCDRIFDRVPGGLLTVLCAVSGVLLVGHFTEWF